MHLCHHSNTLYFKVYYIRQLFFYTVIIFHNIFTSIILLYIYIKITKYIHCILSSFAVLLLKYSRFKDAEIYTVTEILFFCSVSLESPERSTELFCLCVSRCHHFQLVQSVSLPCCAAEAAGAGGGSGDRDISSAATLFQLHKWPAGPNQWDRDYTTEIHTFCLLKNYEGDRNTLSHTF